MKKYFEDVSIHRCKMLKENQGKHSLVVTINGIQSAEVPLIICKLLLKIDQVKSCVSSRLRGGSCKFKLTVCTPIGCDAVTLIKGATGLNMQNEIGRLMNTDLRNIINTS